MIDLVLDGAFTVIVDSNSANKKKYLALKFITESSDLKSSGFVKKLGNHKFLKLMAKLATYDLEEADPFCHDLFKLKEEDGEEYKFFFHRLNLRYIKKWDSKFGVYAN
jgi:hypothetical protein